MSITKPFPPWSLPAKEEAVMRQRALWQAVPLPDHLSHESTCVPRTPLLLFLAVGAGHFDSGPSLHIPGKCAGVAADEMIELRRQRKVMGEEVQVSTGRQRAQLLDGPSLNALRYIANLVCQRLPNFGLSEGEWPRVPSVLEKLYGRALDHSSRPPHICGRHSKQAYARQ